MLRRIALLAALWAWQTQPAWAQDVWKLGGQGGRSWAETADLNVMGDATSTPGALQPWELRPDVSFLPLVSQRFSWDRWQFPLDPFWTEGIPRLWRGPGNQQFAQQFQPIAAYVDGDHQTFNWNTNFGPGGNKTNSEFYTIDPGAPVPLERFEIHLPPEFDPETGAANPDCCDQFGKPWTHYIPHQGELTGSLIETTDMLLEGRGKNRYGEYYKPLPIPLGSVEQHLVAPIIIDFPLQYLRFVRWRTFPDNPDAPGVKINFALAYGEFELYGRGFAGQTRYVSHIQDLGQPATLGKVFMAVSKWRRQGAGWSETADGERRWQVGELVEAPDAEVDVVFRLKNGTDADPLMYFTWNDQGEFHEVERTAWDALKLRANDSDPSFVGWRGPVTEDREEWTPWSGPVNQSGTRLDLPSRRFFRLELQMTTASPVEMARVDSLSIELFPLLVPTLVGEVGLPGDSLAILAQVPIGEPTEFAYAIRAGFGGDTQAGFDALHIATPAEPEFLYLRDAADEAVQPDSSWTDAEGLTLYLPEPIRADETLRIGFKTAVYTVSAQLRGEVFNRANSVLRQQVEEGDAVAAIGTQQLQVVAAGGAVEQVVGGLEIVPRTFTPNGDGHNDLLEIKYTLFGVLDAAVEITFFTLAGEPVDRIIAEHQGGGVHTALWAGRNAAGRPFRPGLYLCQVQAQTGRGRFERTQSVALVY